MMYADELEITSDEIRLLVDGQWFNPNRITMSKEGIWAQIEDGFGVAFVKYDPEMAEKKRKERSDMIKNAPFKIPSD